MAPHHSDGSQVENGTAGAAALLREIEALRRRLAAVEARLPESASAQPSERRQAKARSSAKRVVRLTTGAGLAMLAGGALAYGADALIIGPDGATIFAKSINFGTRLGALLTLYDPGYTIGIQPGTFYQRSYKNFAWYKGGGHTDTELDPGGGSKMMSLTEGNLDVAGTVKAKSLDVDGAGNVTAGTVTTGTLTTGTLTVPAAMLEVNGGLLHVADNTGAPTVTSQGAYLGWNALTRHRRDRLYQQSRRRIRRVRFHEYTFIWNPPNPADGYFRCRQCRGYRHRKSAIGRRKYEGCLPAG
jgi:hypothetical protein